MSKTKYVIMMERETYSNKFYVGYDVIILFVIAVFVNSQVLFQYFQSTEATSDQIFIGIFQLLMGIGGFSIGMIINRDIIDLPKRAVITKEKSTETYLYGTFFAAIVIIVDMFIGKATQSQFDFTNSLMSSLGNVNIPATAGVVEEALFSLTLAILLYKIFKEMFKNYGMMGEMYAIAISTAFTSVFFAMIHLYVYRVAMEALIMMLINRVIYCIIFLKFRNFSMLVWMHIFHNMLVIFMGMI